MEMLLIIAGGGSLLAAALGLLIWRLVKNYGKKEVLEDDMEEKDTLLAGLDIANKARMRLESDDDYAKFVRDKFTRRNP